jgi:hypothetical protein
MNNVFRGRRAVAILRQGGMVHHDIYSNFFMARPEESDKNEGGAWWRQEGDKGNGQEAGRKRRAEDRQHRINANCFNDRP